MIATMCEVAFNVIRDGLEVLWDRIIGVFEAVFFIKSPSRVYAEMKPMGWYSDQAFSVDEAIRATTVLGKTMPMTIEDAQVIDNYDPRYKARDILEGRVPLPLDSTTRPVECRYCGRKHPVGTLGICESCGGVL